MVFPFARELFNPEQLQMLGMPQRSPWQRDTHTHTRTVRWRAGKITLSVWSQMRIRTAAITQHGVWNMDCMVILFLDGEGDFCAFGLN